MVSSERGRENEKNLTRHSKIKFIGEGKKINDPSHSGDKMYYD